MPTITGSPGWSNKTLHRTRMGASGLPGDCGLAFIVGSASVSWVVRPTMKIRIDLLRPKNLSPLQSEPPPPGLHMSGLQSDPSAGPLSDAFFVIVDITKDVAVSVLATWLWFV